MSRYFTSDLHLGSTLINKYAHRPYHSDVEAIDKLTDGINHTCSKTDVLFHVGDFMLNGHDRHGKEVDTGLDYSQDAYLQMLKCRTVLLAGNHDDGHNAEADCKCVLIDLNQNYRRVTVGHVPSDHRDYEGNFGDKQVHVHLCGHVHDAWLLKYDYANHVLNINVGVDVWNYKPVRDSEITKILDFIFDINHDHVNHCHFDRTWTWSRADYEHFVEAERHDAKQMREKRKQERYAKKGLTPEICRQRKEEALRKKGLLK